MEINIREQRKDFFGGDIPMQQVEDLVKVEDRNETILDVAPRDRVALRCRERCGALV
jgi:hypothetical protein